MYQIVADILELTAIAVSLGLFFTALYVILHP